MPSMLPVQNKIFYRKSTGRWELHDVLDRTVAECWTEEIARLMLANWFGPRVDPQVAPRMGVSPQ